MKGKCNTSKFPKHLQNYKMFYKVIRKECLKGRPYSKQKTIKMSSNTNII
jgi:hypothetical protein